MSPSSDTAAPDPEGDGPRMDPGPSWIADLRARLLAFYRERARDLPWRDTTDPYAIWVSEVMSQQTRVETVIPYWTDWLERYPTVRELAAAPEEDVLKSWEGLGYYSRARNLHRAARLVREEHGGRVPDTLDGLRALPGVGPYTAGAVASIAFGIPAPAVDGNVRRVASRLLDWPDPSGRPLQDAVASWIPDDEPGDFNQALMELGATVCTPRSPACTLCPVADLCAARKAGTVDGRPAARKRSPVRRETRIVTVAVQLGETRGDGPRFRLRQRPTDGLLGGMFEFPSVEVKDGTGDEGDGKPRTPPARSLPPVPHQFSHIHVTYRPVLTVHDAPSSDVPSRTGEADPAAAVQGRTDPTARGADEADWYTAAEVRGLPLPVAQQAIFRAALEALGQPELALEK